MQIRNLLPFLLILLASCKENRKFDKALWNTQDDFYWPYRETMLNDLINSHKLMNMRYRDVVNLLGGTNYSDSSICLTYDIVTDYGNDIDPVYGKTLSLKFNKDSVLTSFKVDEWGNR